MAVTYNLFTPVGQTRLQIPDTDLTKPIFSDEEIEFLLSENDENPKLAAAAALEIIAGDPQRLSQWSRGGVSATRTTAAELRQRAEQLRSEAGAGGRIIVGTIERSDFW